jgi:putative transposase
VVGIYRTVAALTRLGGSVLTDTRDAWVAAKRRYFSEGSMAKLYPERADGDAIAVEFEFRM